MTSIKKTLELSTEKLAKLNFITSPRFEAELLLGFVLSKPREYLLAHPEENLDKKILKKQNKLIKKRLSGFSVALLLGEKWFYGFKFAVNKHTLIPRPETEIMVSEIKKILEKETSKTLIADIGTGSGCIILSLTKLLPKNNLIFYGVDRSKKALKKALQNQENLGVKNVNFVKSDLFKIFLKKNLDCEKIIIAANLPYLTDKQYKNSPTIKKEPKKALLSGSDGLNHYKKLFSQIRKFSQLNPQIKISVFCEIDETQTKKITRLIRKNFGQKSIKIKKDLSGHNRLIYWKV